MDNVCIPLPTSNSHVEVLIPSVMRWKDRALDGGRSALESWYFPWAVGRPGGSSLSLCFLRH